MENYDPDYRLGLFYGTNDGKWPKKLTSGIAYYDGLRITKTMFNKYKRWLEF